MMMKAMTDATPWVAMVASVAGSQREAALDQARERRLADPAEAQRGERDAELGGGDVAVERLYRAAGQPSFAIPRPGHLVQPGAPRADQGELGRHEEGVGEHQDDDRDRVRDLSRATRPVPYGFKCSAPKAVTARSPDDSRAGRPAVRGARPAAAPPCRQRSGDPGGRAGASWRTCSPGATRRSANTPAGSTAWTSRPRPGSSTRRAGRAPWAGSPPALRAGAGPGRGPGPRLPRAPARARLSPERADGSVVGMKVTPARPGRAVRAGRQGVVSIVGHHERGPRAGGRGAGDRGRGARRAASPTRCSRPARSRG